MKYITTAILLLPTVSWARYEDLSSMEGRSPMTMGSLMLYLGVALVAWAALMWDQGWKERWQPLALMAITIGAWAAWGEDGVAGASLVAFCWGTHAVLKRPKG